MGRISRFLLTLSLLSLLVLTACGRSDGTTEPEATPTIPELGSSAGSDAPPDSYQPAEQDSSQKQGGSGMAIPDPTPTVVNSPNPNPGGGPYPGPYPEPGQSTGINPYPYPGPGSGSTNPSTPSPEDRYPGPGEETGSGSDATPTTVPYPGPQEEATPLPTPTPLPTATSTPTPTITPTPFPTAIPLDSRIKSTDPTTVDLESGWMQFIMFFAYWDGYSKSMAPIVHELESIYGEEMNFVYLDIDDPATEEFMEILGYEYVPHFFLIDGEGDILQSWQGLVEMDEFVSEIDFYLY